MREQLGLGFGFSSLDGVVGGEERGKPAAEATSALRLQHFFDKRTAIGVMLCPNGI